MEVYEPRRVKKRWIALGALAGLAIGLYLINASWLAHPTGKLHFLAHRGPHQRFHREGVGNDTCTAAQSLPPTHGYLENTLASTKAAFELGADMVEFDIHPTTDGEFAVFHDWTIDCRTEGHGVTREQSMAYLKTLDIGHGYAADGGKTHPFRGRYVGQMPTFAEMLQAFPGRRFLVNIKSNDPHEADLIEAYLTAHNLDASRLSFYGGKRPMARLARLRPTVQADLTARSIHCETRYLAFGWMGYVPKSCKGSLVAVPIGMRRLFWGWPNRFLDRMQKAGAEVYVGGRADFKRKSVDGLDTPAELAKLPKDWKGGVMSDAIEVVGPALKPGVRPFDPKSGPPFGP